MRKFLASASLAAVVAAAPAVGQADFILSTFGPGDSYDLASSWVLSTETSDNASYRAAAASFTVVVPEDYVFTSIDLALGYTSGVNIFEIALRSSDAGLPGAVLESFLVSPPPSFEGGVVNLSSVGGIVLSSGQTYFIVAEAFGDTWGGWKVNSTGAQGVYTSLDHGASWEHSNEFAPAFRVNASVIEVPEPDSLALVGLGLAAVALIPIRRRRFLAS